MFNKILLNIRIFSTRTFQNSSKFFFHISIFIHVYIYSEVGTYLVFKTNENSSQKNKIFNVNIDILCGVLTSVSGCNKILSFYFF